MRQRDDLIISEVRMRIIKVTGFEGGEYEAKLKQLKIVSADIPDKYGWTEITYKVPHGRKLYSMAVMESDLER